VRSGLVGRLASSLGVLEDDLSNSIDPDTVRRTKYPVVVTVEENGLMFFDAPHGIISK